MAAGETLTLAGGADVTLAAGEVYSFVEGLGGIQGLILNSDGQTLTVTSIDHVYGDSGASVDVITLGGTSGNTLGVQSLETVIGSEASDLVSITTFGSTMLVSGIESVRGGGSAGIDVVALGGALAIRLACISSRPWLAVPV